MKFKKKDIVEIIDSNGELIGNNNIPTNGNDLESQASNTTDYNAKVSQQPFRYDMLGRFGFTLLPFFEGKENKLDNDMDELLYDMYMKILEYYYKHPNKLKSDYRIMINHDIESDVKKTIEKNLKTMIKNVLEPYIKKQTKNIDENIQQSISFDDNIKNELKNLFKNTEYDKAGTTDDRINQLFNIHTKWLKAAKNKYSAEEIANKLYIYDRQLRNKMSVIEENIIEDKIIGKKSENEIFNKSKDNEVRNKNLEKIAGLINKKLNKTDINKLINLLENK